MTYQDGFETLAIHAGQEPDPVTGAVVPPIYQVSTYKQDGVGGLRGGYEYSRSANPTRTALEQCLAALEDGARGLAFASGHGRGGLPAQDGLLARRPRADPGRRVRRHVPAVRQGAHRLGTEPLAWSRSRTWRPCASSSRPGRPSVIWAETPTNPLLNIADIRALAEAAHEAGALLVVDNTFASPYLQQPLTLGADVVVHSTTKYLGGHSDVVGGALVVADGELAERLAFTQNATGGVAGPFDSWLTLRGVKTLAVRMDRHCGNAMRVAQMLAEHPAVAEVLYPGLPSHPGHKTAQEQMRAFGGMVSFRLLAGEEAAVRTCGRTRLFTLGESLGGVESLIEHPGRMTHASVTGSPLEVSGDLIRLSVGIEDCDDLLDDLRQALSDS